MSNFYLFAGMFDDGLHGIESYKAKFDTIDAALEYITTAHFEWANVAVMRGGEPVLFAKYLEDVNYMGLQREVRLGWYYPDKEAVEWVKTFRQRRETIETIGESSRFEWVNV